MATISKSGGLTQSEQYLARLCEKSFLSLWSYPNLFRDQGRVGQQGDGKELCDLLVVFGNDIIIFSDKSCQFPSTGDLNVDWGRWYKRAILKSACQVFGAERWIRNYPERVFLDSACTQPFPLPLPPSNQCRIHRIVVALNASERCKQFFNNSGSGSLVIRSDVQEQAHLSNPFCIGQLDPAKGYVHVLDDYTLDVILRELDTISDFTEYLIRKEGLLTSGKIVYATGEEEMLARYLTNAAANGDHDFSIPPDVELVMFDEGSWNDVAKNRQYLVKKAANRQSYLWDALIETYNKHYLGGTLERGFDLPLHELERGVRIMASESRIGRRGLGHALSDLLHRTTGSQRAARVTVSPQRPEIGYAFVVLPILADRSYEEYRIIRTNMLMAYCYAAKLKFPELEHIVGVATEPLGADGRSEDLVYLNASNWTPELQAEAQRIQTEAGVLTKMKMSQHHYDEYPEEEPIQLPETSALRGNRRERRARQARLRREARRGKKQ